MGRAGLRQAGVYLAPGTWESVREVVEGEGASVRSYVGCLLRQGMEIVAGRAPGGLPDRPEPRGNFGIMRAATIVGGPPCREGKRRLFGHLPAKAVQTAKAAAGLRDMSSEDLLMLGLVADFGRRALPFPEEGRRAVDRLRRVAPAKARAVMEPFGG